MPKKTEVPAPVAAATAAPAHEAVTPEAAHEANQVPEAAAETETPPAVSEAAAALGRRARGVPKTLTPERREELREAAAHARGFRVRARPAGAAAPAVAPASVAPASVAPTPTLAPPTTGRRIAAKPVAPTGRRVAARIVAPTADDVAAFGGAQ